MCSIYSNSFLFVIWLSFCLILCLIESPETDAVMDIMGSAEPLDSEVLYDCVICGQSGPSTEDRPTGLVVLLQASSGITHLLLLSMYLCLFQQWSILVSFSVSKAGRTPDEKCSAASRHMFTLFWVVARRWAYAQKTMGEFQTAFLRPWRALREGNTICRDVPNWIPSRRALPEVR